MAGPRRSIRKKVRKGDLNKAKQAAKVKKTAAAFKKGAKTVAKRAAGKTAYHKKGNLKTGTVPGAGRGAKAVKLAAGAAGAYALSKFGSKAKYKDKSLGGRIKTATAPTSFYEDTPSIGDRVRSFIDPSEFPQDRATSRRLSRSLKRK